MSIICTFYSVVKFILSDFEQWYYILLIPISITLIIVLVEIIDWGKLGNFDYWNEIDIDI